MLKTMFAGWLAKVALIAAAITYLLRDRMPFGVLIVVAVLCAIALHWAYAALRESIRTGRDLRLLGGSLKDGERVALLGTIRVDGRPLEAPFGGAECALYAYDVTHHELVNKSQTTGLNRSTRMVIDFTGYALAEAKLDTPGGRFKLLSFPFLTGFPSGKRESNEERAAAAQFLRSTRFEKMSGGTHLFGLPQLDEAVSHAEGAFRRDWEGKGRRDVHELTLQESYVPTDVEACAIGVYDSRRGGIRSVNASNALRLIAGDAEQVRTTLAGERKSSHRVAFVAAPAVALIAWLYVAPASIYGTIPGGEAILNVQRARVAEALRNDDVKTLPRLVPSIDPNEPVDGDVLPLMLARSRAAAAMLLDAGADVNGHRAQGQSVLMEAVQIAPGEVVRLLVERGANVNEVNPTWNDTPLKLARANGNTEAVEVLLAAGAK